MVEITHGDNLAVYMNPDGLESAHCFSCGYTRASSGHKKESYKDRYEYEIEMAGFFNENTWKELRATTGQDPRGWRGLTKEACAFYRC